MIKTKTIYNSVGKTVNIDQVGKYHNMTLSWASFTLLPCYVFYTSALPYAHLKCCLKLQ